MAYIQVRLDAETVIEAMSEDSSFIEEIIEALADALRAGALRGDLHDMANLNTAWNENIALLVEEFQSIHLANTAE